VGFYRRKSSRLNTANRLVILNVNILFHTQFLLMGVVSVSIYIYKFLEGRYPLDIPGTSHFDTGPSTEPEREVLWDRLWSLLDLSLNHIDAAGLGV